MMPEDELENIKSWDLPFVEDTRELDTSRTNAFNRRSDWKYEPPEEEEVIAPPTAQEIEAIRSSAYQDGFEQGKSEGLIKGLEEGKAQGLEEGHAEGLEKGLAEGKESGSEQVKEHIEHLASMLEQLHKPVEQIEQELESELVKLSVSLAKAVIRSEVKTNSDIIFQALSEGLKVLPIQEKTYQIHLHPDDIGLIKTHFSQQEIDNHNWIFIESPDMSRGGCDITTENNAVDVSIERRCKDVLDKFLLEHGFSQIEEQ